MRSLMLILALIGALALGVPAAFATTATNSADGITVTVALSDTAKAGDEFTVAESIANTTTKAKLIRVTQTLEGQGGTIFSIRYPLIVPAGRILAINLTLTFPAHVPPGTYELTLSAGAASATAETVVS